ncbi:MAG: methyltransferase C-terminal domain-containing protein, partial [Pseudomonadota bacterium]
ALLAEDGAVVIEAPYLLDLLDHREFDTIYHQHLLYLTLTSVAAIFAPHGLHLNDAERLRVHGGSLRMTLSRSAERSEALVAALAEEARRGVGTRELYAPFLADLAAMRAEMRAMLDALKAEGARVAGYGAAAKATTLCAWFGIDAGDLEAIADRNAAKQGWSMPGNGIPIVAPEALHADPPDVVLILAWNFANEIMAENADLAARFLVPVPRPRFVTAGAAEMAL